MIVESRIEWCI